MEISLATYQQAAKGMTEESRDAIIAYLTQHSHGHANAALGSGSMAIGRRNNAAVRVVEIIDLAESCRSRLPRSRPITTNKYQIDEEVERTFMQLAEAWRDETKGVSIMRDRILNQNYQKIIGLGPKVVPILIRELVFRPDHWFHALKMITDSNPAGPEDKGDFERIRAAWIEWAKAHRMLNEEATRPAVN